MLRLHRRRKPPSVAFTISRSILTLTVRLIDRLAIDSGARRSGALVVRIDIIDVDDQARIRNIDGERRVELMLGGDTM
jgi:hypothetical protein